MPPIYLVANGVQALASNREAWPAQAAMEDRLVAAVERLGRPIQRAHLFDPRKGHGFVDSRPLGREILRGIPPEAPVIVAVSGWQYSPHVWPGLATHEGPILTVANWGGRSAGVPGMLNLNACLTKAGVKFSSLWSGTFEDEFFTEGLRRWLEKGKVRHDTSHVREFTLKPKDAPADLGDAMRTGRDFARRLRQERLILGVIDEGGTGRDNAVVPDALLHRAGLFKERLSLGALLAKMAAVTDAEARDVAAWHRQQGGGFRPGPEEAAEPTEDLRMRGCRMYVAAVRLADERGCAALGIACPPEGADLVPSGGLAEGTLNSVERPPVRHETTGDALLPGEALPYFHDADGCAGLDALVTYRLWRELGYPPEIARYDLGWGRDYRDETTDAFVWVFQSSGGAPPAHLGGRDRAGSERQPPVFSPQGGGTWEGACRPGWIVWSRVSVEDEKTLRCDAGIAEVVSLPGPETEDRRRQTTPEEPLMHVVLQGITRDQMLARHPADGVQVAYAPDKEGARRGLFAKAAALRELGLEVAICGNISGER